MRGRSRRLRTLRRDERGLVILLWALGFLGLLAFLAIVVETGFVYSERRGLQHTADAAALAGAQALWWKGDPVADAQTWASKNTDDLVDNLASVDGASVTSTVRRNSASLFSDGHWLGFGKPLVSATATARLGTAVLPGPGIFCVGVEVTSEFGIGFEDAYLYQKAYALPNPFNPPPVVVTPDGWYTVLRTGAGAGSNAGYVDPNQGGGGANEVRECMAAGSDSPLVEAEDANGNPGAPVDAEPGIEVGPSRMGLRDRMIAARANGCYSWQEIRQSMLDADQDGDGIVDPGRVWWCSPLNPAISQDDEQGTSVVLLPIVQEQFKFGEIQGSDTFWLAKCNDPGLGCDVFADPDDQPYMLAFFWLDAESTFVDPSSNQWQYVSDTGQGQADLWGVFLLDHPVSLEAPPPSTTRVVECTIESSVLVGCFLQLVR